MFCPVWICMAKRILVTGVSAGLDVGTARARRNGAQVVVVLIIWRNLLQAIWRKRPRLPTLADPEKLGPAPVGKSASHQGRVIYGGIGKASRIPAESCYASSQ
jgi:hypothetical protein